jgi:hypothetical protein
MPEITSIEYLLAADAENAVRSQIALCERFPEAMNTATSAAQVLEILPREWGKVCDYDSHHAVLESWARDMGVSGNEVLKFLSKATLIGDHPSSDPSAKAQVSLAQAVSVISRAYLMVRMARDYLFGLTDLLRLRITPAVGYLRLQAESAGLLKLILEEPPVAQAWLDSLLENQGKAFHDRWHSEIVHRIKDLGLHGAYVDASNRALHSRPWGIARGILLGAHQGKPGRITLVYQEENDPTLLLFAFSQFILFHRHVLEQYHALYPELHQAGFECAELQNFRKLSTSMANRVTQLHRDLPHGALGLLLEDLS